jgi:hypothetical protein
MNAVTAQLPATTSQCQCQTREQLLDALLALTEHAAAAQGGSHWRSCQRISSAAADISEPAGFE